MKLIFIHIIILLLTQLSSAQKPWCDFDSKLTCASRYQLYLIDKEHQINEDKITTRSDQYFQVVVHVVTREGFQHVSEAQVIHQIDILNNDFAGQGENIHKLPAEFKDLAADSGFKFCLADTDPDGNPSSGITYTTTTVTDIGLKTGAEGRGLVFYDQLGGKTGWDPTQYINIWVCEFGGGILGSTSLPGKATFPEETGIVMDIRYFGSMANASDIRFFGKGHTLTHEMGHFFGLFHIWGTDDNNCLDSDAIDDTPNATGPYFGCPSGRQVSCDVSNMYQNFMDLTDDRCLAAFTYGQALRMQTVVELFYPDLPIDHHCGTQVQSLEEWFEDLTWSYDPYSKHVVFYTPDAFAAKINIEVFAADGRIMTSNTWQHEQSILLQMEHTPAGVYFVRISDGENQHVRKIAVY
ncbi:MAG: zinc-dependent metalloprotease [Saprospiraceae bacterium]